MTLSRFGVRIDNRQGVMQVLPPDLVVAPVKWGWNCIGGPKTAEIQVTGSMKALGSLRNWLRYKTQIVSPKGSVVWWGYVHEVELQFDGLTLTASLDNLYNKLKVLYNSTAIGGTSMDTGWTSDTISQAEYGIREHIESYGDATTLMATTLQSRMLNERRNPMLKRSLANSGTVKAILRCRGWFDRLGWRYYQRLDGQVENLGSSSNVQPVGWGVSGSSNIGVGDNALFAVGDYFNHFSQGHRLVLTGCTVTANNLTYTVAGSTSDEVITHTHTLTFEIDDINDPAGDLPGFKAEYWIWVSGSVQNNRFHWIGKADADHVEVKQQIAGELDPEGPTSGVTLTQPQKLSVQEANFTEPPSSANKTVVFKGNRVAQRVTVPVAMYIDGVQLDAAKVGAPSDSLRVEIYSNVSSAPGSLIVSGTLLGSTLLTDMTSVRVPMTKTLLSAADVWVIVWRTGSLSPTDHYLVGMLDTTYSTTLQWTGSAWEAHEPGWSLKFGLRGVDDIGTLAEAAISATMQNLTLSGGYLAGVDGNTYMSEVSDGLSCVEDYVQVGTATGDRILVTTSQDSSVRLSTRALPVTVPNLSLYTSKGRQRITDSAGSDIEPGTSVAGQWLRLAELDNELASEAGLSPAWVEAAEYDAASGVWTITFEGERKLADIIRVQQG